MQKLLNRLRESSSGERQTTPPAPAACPDKDSQQLSCLDQQLAGLEARWHTTWLSSVEWLCRLEEALADDSTTDTSSDKELEEIKAQNKADFRDIVVDDSNILQWTGLIVPNCAPYNKGAFRIKLDFPTEYPFKPPKVLFKTKIYHPNIDEKGQVCLPLIQAENWKPATKTDQVLRTLIAMINEPEPDHPLRSDLAEEYTKDKKRFMKAAEEYTKKHAEKRP